MKNRVPVHYIALAIALCNPLSVLAQGKDPKAAENIGAVWNLSSQPCNGGGGNSMDRHPNESEIKQSKLLEFKDLGLNFAVPQLFETDRTIIKLFMGDQSEALLTTTS